MKLSKSLMLGAVAAVSMSSAAIAQDLRGAGGRIASTSIDLYV